MAIELMREVYGAQVFVESTQNWVLHKDVASTKEVMADLMMTINSPKKRMVRVQTFIMNADEDAKPLIAGAPKAMTKDVPRDKPFSMNAPLEDDTPMPFGKWKGTPMKDVPPDYLHWLWHNGIRHDKNKSIHVYIRDRLDALKTENPDLIWED